MSLFIENESHLILPFEVEETALLVLNAILEYVNCPYESEVNLLLTTDIHMRKLNKEHRSIDKTTDVLSFPMLDEEIVDDFPEFKERMELFHPETGELVLGDIIISTERVLSQAKEYGHSLKREFAFLFAHGVFHLLGFDHEGEKERGKMEQAQKKVLEQLQILR